MSTDQHPNRYRVGDRVRIDRPRSGTEPNPWHGRVGTVTGVPGDIGTSSGPEPRTWQMKAYSVLLDGDETPSAPHYDDGLLSHQEPAAGEPAASTPWSWCTVYGLEAAVRLFEALELAGWQVSLHSVAPGSVRYRINANCEPRIFQVLSTQASVVLA